MGNCVHQMYRLSRFAENLKSADMLNVQNCTNLVGNYVRWMYGMSKYAKKFNIKNQANSTRNCVHQMYGLSRFAKKN